LNRKNEGDTVFVLLAFSVKSPLAAIGRQAPQKPEKQLHN